MNIILTLFHILIAAFSSQRSLPVPATANLQVAKKSLEKPAGVYCSAGGHITAFGRLLSHEDSTINGGFTFSFIVKATDTTRIDSLGFKDEGMFSATIQSNFGASYLLPGDSAIATISVSYDTASIPYYPRRFSVIAHTHGTDSVYGTAPTEALIYFTPYNSTEVWDIADFQDLPSLPQV